jgi:hypothetical protein
LCQNELNYASKTELILPLAAADWSENEFLQLKQFRKERVIEYSISISRKRRTVAYGRTEACRRTAACRTVAYRRSRAEVQIQNLHV